MDLFLATPDIPTSNSSVLHHSFSDHLPIHLQIKCAVPYPPPSLVTHRSFKHFSKSSFEDDLSSVPWSILDVFDDPDDKVKACNLLFTDVLDYHAPLKTIWVRKKKSSLWITKIIRKEMDRWDRLFRFSRRNPTTGACDIFKAQRNHVVWLQRKAKRLFYQLLRKKSHPSHIWNTLKLATASLDPLKSCPNNPSSIANSLNTHFISVQQLLSVARKLLLPSNQTTTGPDHLPSAFLNYACRTVLCKHNGSSASAARRELGLSTLASMTNFTLLLPCSTVCLPSPLLIYGTWRENLTFSSDKDFPRISVRSFAVVCADNWWILCGQLADFVQTIVRLRAEQLAISTESVYTGS